MVGQAAGTRSEIRTKNTDSKQRLETDQRREQINIQIGKGSLRNTRLVNTHHVDSRTHQGWDSQRSGVRSCFASSLLPQKGPGQICIGNETQTAQRTATTPVPSNIPPFSPGMSAFSKALTSRRRLFPQERDAHGIEKH
jgi:hypothetical protein